MKRPSFKRWHPLLKEWVVMAPTTAVRPWSGTLVTQPEAANPEFDPGCYLCPGVERASGATNPPYDAVHVFDNDFPSFSMDYATDDSLQVLEDDSPAGGICRVVCFSPRHNVTLAEMEPRSVAGVLRELRTQFAELSQRPDIHNVMIFENKGAIIGVSNPHPHGQIYATGFVPRIPATQYASAAEFFNDTGRCLFCDILAKERADGRRMVIDNGACAAFVPWFARHTFEVHIMPTRHVPNITDLTDDEIDAVAAVYHEMLVRYDNLFEMSFPNITVFQNAPCAPDMDTAPYHFHIEFSPPLRSHDKLKYMAGFETGGGNIVNPSLPGESAHTLRSVSPSHYKTRTV